MKQRRINQRRFMGVSYFQSGAGGRPFSSEVVLIRGLGFVGAGCKKRMAIRGL